MALSHWSFPLIELHAQRHAQLGKDGLDLRERLRSEVRDFEHFSSRLLYEIADVLDARVVKDRMEPMSHLKFIDIVNRTGFTGGPSS